MVNIVDPNSFLSHLCIAMHKREVAQVDPLEAIDPQL